MDNINIDIKNYDHLDSSLDCTMVHDEKLVLDEKLVVSSIVTISNNSWKTKIKFNLKDKIEITKEDLLLIPETIFLFYKRECEWSAFDLKNGIEKRNEHATYMHFIKRKTNVVLIYDELYVECTDLVATQIDRVPIDPPTDVIEFENRIEFDSPVYGKHAVIHAHDTKR